jgi:hypothetical protein
VSREQDGNREKGRVQEMEGERESETEDMLGVQFGYAWTSEAKDCALK